MCVGVQGEVAAALMATVAPVPLLPGSLGRGQGRGASTELLGGAQERGGDVDGLFSGRPEDFREALKAIVRDPSAGASCGRLHSSLQTSAPGRSAPWLPCP